MGKRFFLDRGVIFLFSLMLILGAVSFMITCSTSEAAASKEPIKIGVLLPLTGPYAMWGGMFKNSLELALDEVKWEVEGRPVKMLIEDEGGEDINMALQKAKKLVQADKVNMIMGPFYGSSAFTVLPYTSSLPMINVKWSQPGSKKDELGNKYAFWCAQMYQDNTYPLGIYAHEKGIRAVVTLGSDYAVGYDFVEGFTDAFKSKGGTVVQQQWAPLTETDYNPYLSNLKTADALVCATLGPPAKLALFKQYAEMGLFKKMPIFIAEPGTLPPPVMREMGDKIIGIIGVEKYLPTLDNAENKKYTSGYMNKYKEEPDDKACDAYNGMKVVLEALKATHGETKAEVLKSALLKVEMKLPTGQFRFSAGRIGMQPLRICEVVKVEGKLQWKIVKEIPPVESYKKTFP